MSFLINNFQKITSTQFQKTFYKFWICRTKLIKCFIIVPKIVWVEKFKIPWLCGLFTASCQPYLLNLSLLPIDLSALPSPVKVSEGRHLPSQPRLFSVEWQNRLTQFRSVLRIHVLWKHFNWKYNFYYKVIDILS